MCGWEREIKGGDEGRGGWLLVSLREENGEDLTLKEKGENVQIIEKKEKWKDSA